jgi:hypothetical protein
MTGLGAGGLELAGSHERLGYATSSCVILSGKAAREILVAVKPDRSVERGIIQ